jgi:8-oxo-dGTP pyrophosphatase MutT (NUDIX family)
MVASADVGRLAAALLASYVPRTEVEGVDVERLRALVDGTEDPWSRAAPLHLTASAVVLHPEDGRVLLRWHERHGRWLQVGGHGDPGEVDPLAVALREGAEETGLTDLVPWAGGRLVHVAVVSVPASAREPAHAHGDLRFVLATATPDAVRPETPRAALRWLALPEARQTVSDDNLRETLDRVDALLTLGEAS